MATPFDNIPTGEIGVDSDVDGLTFTKLVNRDLHLKEIVSASVGAPKIPAQAIAAQTPGSGFGLVVSQFNHLKTTIVQAVAADGIIDVVSAMPASTVRAILLGVGITGGTYAITVEPVWKSTSANIAIRITRDAGGTGTQTVTVDIYGILF